MVEDPNFSSCGALNGCYEVSLILKLGTFYQMNVWEVRNRRVNE